MTDMTGRRREPKGLPTGGRFAREDGAASDASDLKKTHPVLRAASIDDIAAAARLGRSLGSGTRRRPAVVVTYPLALPLGELFAALDGTVDAYVVRDPLAADELFRAAGPGRSAWGGAIATWRGRERYVWKPGYADPSAIADWLGVDRDDPAGVYERIAAPVVKDRRIAVAPAAIRPHGTNTPTRLDADVRAAWKASMPAADLDAHPLPDSWNYADGFAIPRDAPRSKAAGAMADALSGLDRLRRGRQLHQLRESVSGKSAVRRTPTGGIIWRSRVDNSPNPWVLHYAREADGSVTFLSVERHNDLEGEH